MGTYYGRRIGDDARTTNRSGFRLQLLIRRRLG